MTFRIFVALSCICLLAACREQAPSTPAAPVEPGAPVAVPAPTEVPSSEAPAAQGPVIPEPATGDVSGDVLDAVLREDDTLATAKGRLGDANVVAREIHYAEGEMMPGWMLYPDDPKRVVEVFLEKNGKRPAMLRVSGKRSAWRRSDGIRLGQTTSDVQAMNGKPFELAGFYWDYAGTVMDWRGGKLANGGKSLGFVRFCPPEGLELPDYPSGEGAVRSDIPAMVAHPAQVCEYSIVFRDFTP